MEPQGEKKVTLADKKFCRRAMNKCSRPPKLPESLMYQALGVALGYWDCNGNPVSRRMRIGTIYEATNQSAQIQLRVVKG
jgi:hypothetical protein